MRITESMITSSLLSSISRNKESMYEVQQKITTGKESDRVSADPGRFVRSTRFRKQISQNDQYLENIQDAEGWMQMTTTSLDGLFEHALNLKEKAVQSADDSLSSSQRTILANEVNGVIEEMISMANESYLGKNLFAGTKTQESESFTYDGTTVTYNGNDGYMSRRLAEHMTVNINVTGQDIVDTGFFSSAIDLKTAMSGNDTAGINTAIGSLETAMNSMINLNSGVGSIQNQVLLAKDRLETANMNLSSYLSDTEDVDMAVAITQYNAQEVSYRAALQSAADVVRLNLMDYIR